MAPLSTYVASLNDAFSPARQKQQWIRCEKIHYMSMGASEFMISSYHQTGLQHGIQLSLKVLQRLDLKQLDFLQGNFP